MIKLIGLDLDGTLFDSFKRVSNKNIIAISRAIEKGVAVAPVTGRSLLNIPEKFTAIEGVNYAVTTNGSSVYRLEDGACLYRNWLAADKALEILKALEGFVAPACCFIEGHSFMDSKWRAGIYDNGWDKPTADYFYNQMEFVNNIEKYIEDNADSVEKITVNLPFENGKKRCGEQIYGKLTELGGLSIVSGNPYNFEITKEGVNKGSGLLALGEALGISLSEIMGVGDDGNDYMMIKSAGLGVAMENAVQPIKDIADFITLSNDNDGVAYAIEKFVL